MTCVIVVVADLVDSLTHNEADYANTSLNMHELGVLAGDTRRHARRRSWKCREGHQLAEHNGSVY